MRLPIPSIGRAALLFASFLALFFGRAVAQTTNIPARITQAIYEKNLRFVVDVILAVPRGLSPEF